MKSIALGNEKERGMIDNQRRSFEVLFVIP